PIASNRLIANDTSIRRKATSRARAMAIIRRGWRDFRKIAAILLPYNIRVFRAGPCEQCATISQMSQAAPAITRSPADIVKDTPVSQAANGICYAVSGQVTISESDLERMIAAVPRSAAVALNRKAYYFVPLTV